MPVLVWLAVGALMGGGGVVAASSAADEIGDAVEQSANAVANLTKWAVILGIIYLAWANRDIIRGMMK